MAAGVRNTSTRRRDPILTARLSGFAVFFDAKGKKNVGPKSAARVR